MNEFEQLKAEMEQVKKQAAAMREALNHCLEASSDPPKFGRFLTKQDRDIIFAALKPDAGHDFISREKVKPLVLCLQHIWKTASAARVQPHIVTAALGLSALNALEHARTLGL